MKVVSNIEGHIPWCTHRPHHLHAAVHCPEHLPTILLIGVHALPPPVICASMRVDHADAWVFVFWFSAPLHRLYRRRGDAAF